MLQRGLAVTVNSDDPAYFGGYVGANFEAVAQGLDLSADDVETLVRNSFTGSFLTETEVAKHLAAVDRAR